MIVFPNCKLNLGLRITQRREDGYHSIETAFLPIPIYDILEVIKANGDELVSLQQSGQVLNIAPQQNICIKAYHIVKRTMPHLPPTSMWLHKEIPSGAGMGGGSADGAFVIKALNDFYKLGMSINDMKPMALKLGSDCPFFIENKVSIGMGRGEHLEPLPLSLQEYALIVVTPGIHINTAWAFGKCVPVIPAEPVSTTLRRPVKEWRDFLLNDFEPFVFSSYPEIAAIKNLLYDSGAVYASMTGTGSTVFAFFERKMNLPDLHFPSHYFVKWIDNISIRN